MNCPDCAKDGKYISMFLAGHRVVRYSDGEILVRDYICPTQKRSGRKPYGCGKRHKTAEMIRYEQ